MQESENKLTETIRLSFSLLTKTERTKFLITTLLQIFLSILDLVGVLLIGAIAALAINGISGKGAGDRVSFVLGILSLDGLNLQTQTVVLGIISSILLVSKTIISFFVTKKTSHFLSRRSAAISNTLFKKLLQSDLNYLRKRSTQKYLFALTSSVQAMVNGILITFSTVFGDLVLTATLIFGMSILDWKISIFTIVFYGLVAIILNKGIKNKYIKLGKAQSDLIVESNSLFLDAINSYRDIVVRNSQSRIISNFSEMRIKLAGYLAEFTLSSNISKYSMEVALVVGSILVCAFEFATQDASRAIATLTVFLASSTRIAPAIMRIQQGLLTVRTTIASTETLTEIVKELGRIEDSLQISNADSNEINEFDPTICISNVDFQYPNDGNFRISNLNLEISSGEFCAFVGPSGGGKSTIVDLILGVINPSKGSITISGKNSSEIFSKFKGKVGYVPQEVNLIDGTLQDNIYFYDLPDLNKLGKALADSQLEDLVDELPEGFLTKVGERGTRLSGGQKQRLGIARALYTEPSLLILDEATSALDGKTESEISKTIHGLKGKKTVIVIAHRLSTVRDADLVVYIDKGMVLAKGTFEQVRALVPDFDKQAKLMNL